MMLCSHKYKHAATTVLPFAGDGCGRQAAAQQREHASMQAEKVVYS
jgi:hypothetical protein